MKKSVIMIPLLLSATVVTIFLGQKYSADQREAMDRNQVALAEGVEEPLDEQKKNESKPEETLAGLQNTLDDYESNSASLSLYEQMDYVSLKNDVVSLAYYGDIDVEEPWVRELNTSIENAVSGTFNVLDHSHFESDSYDLYIQQTVQAVINENPDVIIYKMPALADKTRDMGLSESEEFMSYILNSLVTLEDTELILLDPYPIPGEMGQVNSRSLDYQSYLARMHSVAEDYDLPVIPLHSLVLEESSENSLDSYFDENDRLTEEGTRTVTYIIDEFFNAEL